ncbi:hypothetical protein B566_EDAN018270 [Ephemera danica]|nr:hypothetical protein B566_EDAN018270 [Ephemera danica]
MNVNEDWLMKETDLGFSIFIKIHSGQQRYEPPQWNHVLQQVLQCSKIWDDTYRLAAKFFILQRELMWGSVRLDVLSRVWQHHGLRSEDNSMLLSASALRAVLEDTLFATKKDPTIKTNIDVDVGAELTACYLWQLFDKEREGKMTLLNAKVALAVLCRARPQDVCQFLAREAANHDGQVSERRLRAVLETLLVLPCALGEEGQLPAERSEMVELLLRSCFTQDWVKVKDQASIENWLAEADNPLLSWLCHLARMRASDQVVYIGACTVCKRRLLQCQVFRCEWCIWYWICQRCFLAGRYTLNHKLEHKVTDHITPVTLSVEKCVAMKRVMKVALCLGNSPSNHHYPTEPTLMHVPPVKIDTPTSEPLRNLRHRMKDIMTQLELEARKLQVAAAKWQSLQDAGPILAQHGQKLQILGTQLSQLVIPVGPQRPESTPLNPTRQVMHPSSGFVPRILELSPIMAAKTVGDSSLLTQKTEDSNCLELSTILQQHASVQPSVINSEAVQPIKALPANVALTLDKLQSLLTTSTIMEGNFTGRDNEQLAKAVHEFEELLGGLITGIEKVQKQPLHTVHQ